MAALCADSVHEALRRGVAVLSGLAPKHLQTLPEFPRSAVSGAFLEDVLDDLHSGLGQPVGLGVVRLRTSPAGCCSPRRTP